MPRDGGAGGVTFIARPPPARHCAHGFFFCIPLIEAMAVKCCGVVNVAHACTDDGGGSRFRRSSRALLPLRIMDDRGMGGDSRGVGFALR